MNQDRSARYQGLKRWSAVAGVLWSGGLLLALVLTPGSVVLRDAAERLVALSGPPSPLVPALVVGAYVVFLGLIHEIGSLPISWYRGYRLEHRYGLSRESFWGWSLDQAKGLLVGGAFSLAGFSLIYAAIRRWPSAWWFAAAAGFVVVSVGMTRLAPVLVLPIFFKFSPLQRDDLRRRLVTLSERAGIKVLDVCVWQLSDRTRKANAALTGLGRSRRILLSDTLLSNHSDDEVEVILAHEIAHHVRRDTWKGIALETSVAALAFFLASKVLSWAWRPLGWDGVSDAAGLPCVLLAGGVLAALLLPLGNALSRRLERRADLFALELTGNAHAFASAMRRLGVQNLAEERPSRVALWLFHSHPPIGERIAAALDWESRSASGQPPRPRP